MYGADVRFVSFAELLAPAPVAIPIDEAPVIEAAAIAQAPVCEPETRDALRAARVFHATLADAFDALLARLVRDLCAEILARELNLQPVEVSGIAQRLLVERAHDGPLRLHVATADAHVACGVPVVVDRSLQPGDAVLECANGSVDARLGIRLADLMAAVTR
ncbi:MAG: hypothetical protein NVSMB5_03800 [Candidatus Velthaea sp.]